MNVPYNSSTQSEQEIFLHFRKELEREMSEYVYEVPTGSMGTPWSAERVANELREMRQHLVQPRWEQVAIARNAKEATSDERNIRRCILLAEDEDYVLVFDPVDSLYHLGHRQEHGIATWGINGSAIDCFLAR
jgi:hypothetical protein